MSLQIRRGSEAERLTITPLTGELIYTTDTQLVYVGDDVTLGGILVSGGGGPGNYGNANVATFLASGTDTQNIITTANVSASFFIGDGGFLSNVGGGGSYGNADVALFLPTYTGNLDSVGNIGSSGNISAVGEITSFANVVAAPGAFFIGDGGFLSNIAGGIEYVYQTSNYSVLNNQGVLANTVSGVFTVTLPAAPTTGDQCVVADAGGAFGTNNLTVGRNGSTIEGVAQDLILDITGVSVQLIYDGSTWQVYSQVGGAGGSASNYGNANVAAFLPTYSGNLDSIDTIITTGNITAGASGFFLGDGGLLSNVASVVSIPAVYFDVTADGNNQTFSNTVLSAYTSNTDITLFYNGALLDSPYYTFSGDTLTINTELTTGDSIDVIRQFASNVVVSTYGNSNVYSYLESGSVGNILPAGNNIASLGSPTNQFKDVWVSNATIYFDGLPLSVDANAEITFNGLPLVASDGNLSITTSGNVDAGNVVVIGDTNSNSFSGNTANFAGNITVGGILTDNYYYANGTPFNPGGNYSNANVESYLPTYTGNLDNVDAIATTGNITVGTGSFILGDGGLLSNVASAYGNANVAAYLPIYNGNLDSVNYLTANVISSNATIIANSVTLGSQVTPVSVSQWIQLTTASAVPIVLMTIPAAGVTHIDFNVVATDVTSSSRQVSKLMAIYYDGNVNYNEYGSLLIGTVVGDFTISTGGTDIFLNVIPSNVDSVDYNVVAVVYY